MNKKTFLFIASSLILLSSIDVEAQRGCCSWHGGVTSGCSNGKIVCQDGTTSPSCTCSGGTTTKTYTAPTYTYGCTNKDALNYNSAANKDDGSCIDKVLGCMNSDAINYNSSANVADGSCNFSNIKTTKQKIKYKTKYVYSFFKKEGTIKRKGRKGLKEITTTIMTDESGNEVSSKITSTKIIKKEVNKLIYTKNKSKVTK